MTNIEKIFIAAKTIFVDHKQSTFSRNDIRKQLGLSTHRWDMSFTSLFQGMVDNVPPLKFKIRPKFRNVFTRVDKGLYEFTNYGLSLFNEFDDII